ncbi:MAG: hypothetical protein ACP5GY_02975 [Vulcanisaeta sp.]
MISKYQALMYVGIILIIISIILMYHAHQLSSLSYNHVNATTCLTVLKVIVNGSLAGTRINSLIDSLEQSLIVSIEVHISYVNGSSIKYGYYIPIGPSGVFITPISSGNYEIFGRSYCAYVGNGYTISVFIGEYPQPIYLFSLGVAMLIVGFVLIAISDYFKDRRMHTTR